MACRYALGGTLHLFGARASHRVRIQRNDTVPRTHKFIQLGGINTRHGRARPATKGDGIAARAAWEYVLGGTLLPLGVRASCRVPLQADTG